MRRKKVSIFFVLLLYILTPLVSAQQEISEKEFRRKMLAAESLFQYEADYDMAIPLLQELHSLAPENANVSYKLGVCYLQTEYHKEKAIGYLLEALRNTVPTNSYDNLGEKAPIDALFYMGYAYQATNKLDLAIEYYQKFRSSLKRSDIYEIEYIDQQIDACRAAIEAKKNPIPLDKTLSPLPLNDYFNAFKPYLSANDSLLFFTAKEEEKNHLFLSRLEAEGWSSPRDITKELRAGNDAESNFISSDGTILLIYKLDGMDGNLYYSTYTKDRWEPIRKFGKTINTKYWESSASLNEEGNTLYFSSNRPGGYGELDIYRSEIDQSGNWREAENLGPQINTKLEDNLPVIRDSMLFFSSQGHQSIGGYDLYKSRLMKNGKWSEPVNPGYPLNTTDDDLKTFPLYKDSLFLQALYKKETENIRFFETRILEGPRDKNEYIQLLGSIRFSDHLFPAAQHIQISIAPAKTDTLLFPLIDTSAYRFTASLMPEEYTLTVSCQGYMNEEVSFDLSLLPAGADKYEIQLSLTPEEVSSGEFLYIDNILFGFDSFSLHDTSKTQLDRLVPILTEHPQLKLELVGYTDAKGNAAYNKTLSEQRAAAVKSYLGSRGIPEHRLSIRGEGANNYVARNTTADGKDNPYGRQLNRRVCLRIKNPGGEFQISQTTYIPKHRRNLLANRYYIILLETTERLYRSYFERYDLEELLFVRPIRTSSSFIYTIGEFHGRLDALKQLVRVRQAGFNTAVLVDQKQLDERTRMNLDEKFPGQRTNGHIPIYTLQLHALMSPLPKAQWPNVPGVREILGQDGYYRYIKGEYKGYAAARKALEDLQRQGFTNAFIKEINLLERQTLGEEEYGPGE